MQVARRPDQIDLGASRKMSEVRSGHIAVSPPIMIPKLPKLAKPHKE